MSSTPNALVDLEVERIVLGQCIAHRAYGLFLESGLTVEHFYRREHGYVWEAIAAVEQAGAGADIVSVGQELRQRQRLNDVGTVYFSKLMDGMPAPSSVTALSLASRLMDCAALRTIQASAEHLGHEVSDNPDAIADGVLSQHLSVLEQVLGQSSETRQHQTAAAQLESLAADVRRDEQGRIWLGLPTLDEIVDGCRAGEVLGLMARPGIGKTLVLGHVARVTAESELPHVFFSLEMQAAPIVERLVRALYRLGRYEMRDAIKAGTFNGGAYLKLFDSLVVVDTPGLSVADMAARLRIIQSSLFRDRPIRLVTIDHLGLIGGDRRMAVYDRVSTHAREIKELAKRLNATVLLAVQVNRDSGGDGSRELGLGSARDSGVVEEAMDYLIALRRLDQSTTLSTMEREKYRDLLFAKVVKNRHGMTGKEIAIAFDARFLTLAENKYFEAETSELQRIAQGRR